MEENTDSFKRNKITVERNDSSFAFRWKWSISIYIYIYIYIFIFFIFFINLKLLGKYHI
jgi:hypothetical protein